MAGARRVASRRATLTRNLAIARPLDKRLTQEHISHLILHIADNNDNKLLECELLRLHAELNQQL